MLTKTPIIPWAIFNLRFWVNVQEWTLFVTALPCTKKLLIVITQTDG